MIQIQRWKVVVVALICAWGVLYAVPSFLSKTWVDQLPRWLYAERINLGLDLQGGSHLLLEVDTGAVKNDRLLNLVDDVRVAFRNEKITYTDLGVQGDAVTARLRDPADREKALTALRAIDAAATVAVSPDSVVRFSYDEKAWQERYSAAIQQSLEIVRRRIDETGTKETTIVRHGLDRILVQLPGVDDPERVKRLLGTTAKMSFHMVDTRVGLAEIESGRAPAGSTILEYDKPDPSGRREKIAVLRRVAVSGENLTDAQPNFNQNGEPVVSFRFDGIGARKFGEVTNENVGKPFAIVLDNRVISAPVIREPILGGAGQISGGFTVQAAQELALLLRAGALPAPLKVLEERTVGPDLGSDSIRAGTIAIIIGYLLIAVLMIVGYGLFGIFANVTLMLNIAFTITIMSAIGATLTLPGLAGMVLGLAMAVDANVLIYERIREELDRGAAVRMAIRNGFQRAFSTIIDSNLTTLITGVVLFAIGTDQLKGFAITLILGLVLNLFTAVFCSRVVFDLAERARWLQKLSMGRLLGKTNFQYVRWVRPAVVVSLAIIALGAVAAFRRGPELFDIDFTGGTSVQVELKEGQELPIAEVRRLVGEKLRSATVSSVTLADGVADRRFKIDSSNQDEREVERLLKEAFPGRLATYSMRIGKIESIGEGVAKEQQEGESAEFRSVVPLTFPEKIARSALTAKLEEALAAEDQAGAAFDLQSNDPAAASKPCRDWALSLSLDADASRRVLDRMAATITGTPVYLSANAIGGKVAGNTRVTAVYAMLVSLALIVLYVWLRFQNVAFGIAAVVALAHDVLVALAFLAASRYLAPFLGWAQVDPFRISLDVVAALLTIVGFSINDTIVIFDRLREIRGKAKFVTEEMIDRAVNQTLSRTILTSGTTLLVVLLLYVVGGPGIHAFAFTMLVGVISGTYSTIYIASPLVLWLQHRFGMAAVAERAVAQTA